MITLKDFSINLRLKIACILFTNVCPSEQWQVCYIQWRLKIPTFLKSSNYKWESVCVWFVIFMFNHIYRNILLSILFCFLVVHSYTGLQAIRKEDIIYVTTKQERVFMRQTHEDIVQKMDLIVHSPTARWTWGHQSMIFMNCNQWTCWIKYL